MKFKVLKGTVLFQQLEELFIKVNSAHKAALSLIKEIGANSYRPSSWSIGGGISSLAFNEEKDSKMWKKMSYGKFEYMPKTNNKEGRELMNKIHELPMVSWSDLTKLLTTEDDPFWCPGVVKTDECFLFDISDKHAKKLNADLIEILNSEYFALKEAHEAKKTTSPTA